MRFQALNYIRMINFREELVELYTSRMLRAFAFSLIGVFIPIYFLELGFSFEMVMFYLLMKYLMLGITSPVSAWLEGKLGVKHTMMISTLLLTSFFLLLYSITIYNWPILLLGAIAGIEVGLYWIPLNTDFAAYSKKGKIGKETGMLSAFPRLASVAAPLIGALIIITFEFNVLLISACLIMIGSSFPLFLTRDHKFKMKKPIKDLFMRSNWKYFDIFFAKGLIAGSIHLWPLFLYYLMKSYVFVGGLTTLEALLGVITALFIGKIIDRSGAAYVIKIGAIASFVIWFLAMFAFLPWHGAVLAFFVGIAWVLFTLPTFAYVCSTAKKTTLLELMTFREVILAIARAFVFAIAIIMPFEYKFQAVFLLSALASLYLIFRKA